MILVCTIGFTYYVRPNSVVGNDIAMWIKFKMADFCRRLNSNF